jgi:hypothetical protein
MLRHYLSIIGKNIHIQRLYTTIFIETVILQNDKMLVISSVNEYGEMLLSGKNRISRRMCVGLHFVRQSPTQTELDLDLGLHSVLVLYLIL